MPPLRLKASLEATARISAATVVCSRAERRQHCNPCSFLPFRSSLLDQRLGRALSSLASASHEPAALLPGVHPPGKLYHARPNALSFRPLGLTSPLPTLQAETCPCTYRDSSVTITAPGRERRSEGNVVFALFAQCDIYQYRIAQSTVLPRITKLTRITCTSTTLSFRE